MFEVVWRERVERKIDKIDNDVEMSRKNSEDGVGGRTIVRREPVDRGRTCGVGANKLREKWRQGAPRVKDGSPGRLRAHSSAIWRKRGWVKEMPSKYGEY